MIKASFFPLSLLLVSVLGLCIGCTTISDPEMSDQLNNWNGVYNIGGSLAHTSDTQIAQLNQIAASLPPDAANQSALLLLIAGALAHANDAQINGLQVLAVGSIGGLGGTAPGAPAMTPPAAPGTPAPTPAPSPVH